MSHNDEIVLFSYFSICSMFGLEPGTVLSGTLLSSTPVEPNSLRLGRLTAGSVEDPPELALHAVSTRGHIILVFTYV
jgi:hypothetical protein